MITVESVTKTYGSLKAVNDVSFEVGGGEIVGIGDFFKHKAAFHQRDDNAGRARDLCIVGCFAIRLPVSMRRHNVGKHERLRRLHPHEPVARYHISAKRALGFSAV